MSCLYPRPLTAAAVLCMLVLSGCAGAQTHPHHPSAPPAPPAPLPEPVASQPNEACAVLGWGRLPSQFPGNGLAARLDEGDCQKAWVARQAALGRPTPAHEPIYWTNDTTANYGSFTATTETPPKGPVCRQYDQLLVIDGATSKTSAWACLQRDGSWKLAGSLS